MGDELQEQRRLKSIYVTKKPTPVPVMKASSPGLSVLLPGSSTSRERPPFSAWLDPSLCCQQLFTASIKVGRDSLKSCKFQLPTHVVCLPSESPESSLSPPEWNVSILRKLLYSSMHTTIHHYHCSSNLLRPFSL